MLKIGKSLTEQSKNEIKNIKQEKIGFKKFTKGDLRKIKKANTQ